MKKSIFTILLALTTTAVYAETFECNRYVNGKYEGYTKVQASSKDEAVQKAHEIYKDMGKRADYIKCEYTVF